MIMTTKQFHIGDLISLSTDRLVSPRHMDGLYDILNYMTGDNLWTHQLPRACDVCRPHLHEQHPWLEDPEIQTIAIGELMRMLESPNIKSQDDAMKLVMGWLSKLASTYGEMHAITPLEKGVWNHIDPVDEAVTIKGKDNVVAVVVNDEHGS